MKQNHLIKGKWGDPWGIFLFKRIAFTAFLLVCFIQTYAGNSKKTELTVNLSNTELVKVLDHIENISNYMFIYNEKFVNTSKKVSISVHDKNIEDVLDALFSGTDVKYSILGRKIILSSSNKTSTQQPQVVTIKGQVKDASGNLLPGVTIVLKGTTTGTITDANGNFSFSKISPSSVLEFSFVGMEKQEIPLAGKTNFNIVMKEKAVGIEEVVAIAYGTVKKGDITSSVAQIKADDFIKGNVQDAGQLIQGKVAGLSITTVSGDPTGSSEIKLRGTNTIEGTSTSPLILIDGIPGDFNSVASEDIESINVLKDASAAAIYGTQGANGVIIITTKQASGTMKNSVSYSGYVSTQNIYKRLDLMNATQLREKIDEGYGFTDLGYDTNWLDQITRTPISHAHNLTFRGGNPTTNYLFNVNYKSLEGYFLKSDNQKVNIKADVNQTLFGGLLKVNLGAIIRHQNYDCTGDGYSFDGYTYRQSIIYNPTAPLKTEDGSWYENTGLSYYENPVARLKESDGTFHSSWNRYYGSGTLNPFKNLIFKALFSYSKYDEMRGYYETKNNISTVRDGLNGYASYGTIESIDKLLELTANYSLTLNEHKIKLLAGYSYKDNDYYSYWMQNCDFPTDQFSWYDIAIGNGLQEGNSNVGTGSSRTRTNLIATFGRLNYSFRDKYLLMASLRYEGASQLYGSDNQWGLFPAVSAGWKISEEPFMKNQTFISNLKLRAGYGVTGAQPSSSFLAVSAMSYDEYFYADGDWIQTLQPSRNANPNLKWEERHETNIGLDYGILNDKITGSVDYYYRRVNGLLMDYDVPVPPNLVSTTMANVGKMDNEGLEVLINANPFKTKNFSWNTSITFSTNRNKLITLSNDLYESSTGYITAGSTGEPISTYTHRVDEGGPVGNFYGFKVVGAYVEDDDGVEGARWIYEDADGNQVKSEDFSRDDSDKRVLGNGIPKYHAGWNNTFKYKKFDLSIAMRGAFGFQILDMPRMYYENTQVDYFNRLNSAFDKVYGKAVLSQNEDLEFNSYYIENGAYWKIGNITLGYSFDLSRIKYIQSARIYGSCMNCYTITGYKGIDPEVSTSGLDPGIDDRDAYPTARTFTFGVDVNF